MSASVIGALRVNLGLDSANFQQGLKQSQSSLAAFGKKMAVVAAGVAAAGTAAFAGFNRATDSMAQLRQQAGIAGESAERFKIASLAVERYGISQEKLADVLKDVNDKIGDFAATGGGQLKDFFDNVAPKVGLTVEAFEGLSSSQALAKYVTALEDANLSQAEMTFYLEALANDATALIPAFRDGGAEIEAMAARTKELGLSIDESLIDRAQKVQEDFRVVSEVLGVQFQQALLKLAPELSKLTQWFAENSQSIGDFSAKFLKGAATVVAMGQSIVDFGAKVREIVDAIPTWAAQMVDGLKQGLRGFYQAGVDAIADLGRGIRDSVQGLVEEMKAIGGHITDGLRAGLESGKNRIQNTMRNVGNWITGPFRASESEGGFEVRSPSRVFMRFGQYLMEGLAIGINNGAGGAVDAMNRLSGGVAGAMDGFKREFGDVVKSVADGAQTLPEAIGQMLDGIASRLRNSGIDGLMTNLFGSIFGRRDPLASALSGAGLKAIPAFANGGTMNSTGWARINERGGELVRLPGGSTVVPHDLSRGAMSRGTLKLVIEEAPGFAARVRTEAQGVAVETTRQGIASYDRALPTRVQGINAKPRMR